MAKTVHPPILPARAWELVAARCAPLPAERVPRASALGRRLARDVAATTALPAFDTSAMDGFALAGEVAPGAWLPVAGTLAAGDAPGRVLAAGEALRIFTGAPVPPGADRVVAIEQTEETEGRVRIVTPPAAGAAIRRQGEIVAPGSPLLAAGARLGPAALALLASQGIGEVEAIRATRVAVVPTGDEVVPPDATPRPGQLRDSHTSFLLAACARLGVEARAHPIAPDEPRRLGAVLEEALEATDVLLVCGGVSMGGRDHTEEVLRSLGATIEVRAVAVQPGKPLVFAHRGAQLIFGLPGNPVSVMVSFRLFVAPALGRLAGDGAAGFWTGAETHRLATALGAGRWRDRFVPARWADHAAGTVEPLGIRGSHDLVTVATAERLLRVAAGAPARAAGDEIEGIAWE